VIDSGRSTQRRLVNATAEVAGKLRAHRDGRPGRDARLRPQDVIDSDQAFGISATSQDYSAGRPAAGLAPMGSADCLEAYSGSVRLPAIITSGPAPGHARHEREQAIDVGAGVHRLGLGSSTSSAT
jgi:hypothetical protein